MQKFDKNERQPWPFEKSPAIPPAQLLGVIGPDVTEGPMPAGLMAAIEKLYVFPGLRPRRTVTTLPLVFVSRMVRCPRIQ